MCFTYAWHNAVCEVEWQLSGGGGGVVDTRIMLQYSRKTKTMGPQTLVRCLCEFSWEQHRMDDGVGGSLWIAPLSYFAPLADARQSWHGCVLLRCLCDHVVVGWGYG